MKTLLQVSVVLALTLFVTSAFAKEKSTAPKLLNGAVVKVDGLNLVVNNKVKGEVTVVTDKDTAITLDGAKATLADLKAGMKVRVSPAEGTAKTITAKAVSTQTPK